MIWKAPSLLNLMPSTIMKQPMSQPSLAKITGDLNGQFETRKIVAKKIDVDVVWRHSIASV
jgi:hypothetical protein